MSALERRIAAALTDEINSDDLAALIAEVEEALVRADKAAEAARKKSLDLVASPNSTKAREAMHAAEFARDRLHNALPDLQVRHEQVADAEYYAAWRAEYDVLAPEGDSLAAELAEKYPQWETEISDLFDRISKYQEKMSRLHERRPAGSRLHLTDPELLARGIDHFTKASPSLLAELQLPAFGPNKQSSWPPPRTPLAVLVAVSMTPAHDPRLSSGDWAQAQKEDNARRAANEARWDREEEERQVKSRHDYERSLLRR